MPVGRFERFVAHYGWRAYALPVLLVVTVVALVPGLIGSGSGAGKGTRNQGAPAVVGSTPAATSSPAVAREGAVGDRSRYQPGATPTPVPVRILGTDAASCAGNPASQLVVVSISQQRLWACQRQIQVRTSVVTTGASVGGYDTPLGSWRVQAKQRDRYLVGPGYQDFVQYWVPFNGDFGFHDASWQTIPFGSSSFRSGGSHGCVHLPTPMMAWLFAWTSVDDTVVTVIA